jgi:dihydrofolate reductase
MRKLRLFAHISLDGVIQNSAEAGFPYPDWTAPYRSPEGRDALLAVEGESFDLLLGRATYDLWAGSWPAAEGPMADRINGATKYVVTHRPGELSWGPVENVGPDVVEGVRRILAQAGPDLVLWGSSTLTSTLLEHGLADEVVLIVYPVLLGTGKRFFAAGAPAQSLTPTGSQTTPSGLVLNTYRTAGALPTRT